MSINLPGVFLLFVGPAGVGKSTVLKILREKHSNWIFPITATTRPPRPGETGGKDYYFLSEEEFQDRIFKDEFLEWANVHGKHRYGLLAVDVLPHLKKGETIVRELDIQGCKTIHEKLGNTVISFFLLPPPRKILIQRIKNRAPISDEELDRRLQSMKREVVEGKKCTYQVETLNDKPEATVHKIEEILRNESASIAASQEDNLNFV